MTSEVEICNLALSNIRAGSINSLDESSLQAQQCKLKYPILRDRCLTETIWSFNHKVSVLALSTTEIFTWAYSYQYPNDCLKINRLIGPHEELSNANADVISRLRDTELLLLNNLKRQIPYEVFNFSNVKLIGSNESSLRIDYSARVTNPALYNVDFIMALSHLLSAELAIPIIGAEVGRSLRTDSLNLYSSYLNSAMVNDLNDQYSEPAESEFVTIRR